MAEKHELIALVQRARYHPIASKLLFHPPNEGKRHPGTGHHLKRQGMSPGVPDICLPYPRGKYHGFYLELKVKDAKKTRVTCDQLLWLHNLREVGNYAEVGYGWEDAWKQLEWYLNLGSFHVEQLHKNNN